MTSTEIQKVSSKPGAPEKNNDLQLVPEAVLKRKHDIDEMKANWAAQALRNPRGNRKIFNAKTKVIKVIKPESVLSKARMQRNHSRRYARVLKKGMQARASDVRVEAVKTVVPDGTATREEEEELKKEVQYASNSVGAKLVFVVRIRDPVGMPKNVKKVLTTLRLKCVNEGVFCRYNESNRKKLQLIEPWVTYGIPSKAIVTDLIRRRGHGWTDGKRVPLSDNTIIENALGDKTDGAVICVDDVVHELHSVGEEFTKVMGFLWPFQLAAPRSKFQKEKLNFKDGGDYGDRGEQMDDLIRQML